MPFEQPPLFATNPAKVGVLLTELREGKLALPEFQRSFIWPARNTARLLSSLMARYPAGAILTWRAGDHKLADRPVEGGPAIPQGVGLPERLVLDGQQRLTSLYRAYHAIGEARFNVVLGQFVDRESFDLTDPDEIDWDWVVKAYEPTAKQRKALKNGGELPEYQRLEWQLEHWEFPVDRLAESGGFDVWLDKLVATLPPGKDVDLCKGRLREVRDRYLNQLTQYEFPVIQLTSSASLRAVCRIFETLNTNTVKLGVFEILTARFYPDVAGVDLRAMWKEAKANHVVLRDPIADKDPDGYGIDPYTILQVITLRIHGSPQQKVVIDKLTASDVKRNWDSVVAALKAVIEHLRDACGVIHRDLLSYQMLLVPLSAAWMERATMNGPAQGAALSKLERYFWASAFTTNFDQGGASQAELDYRQLVKWLHDEKAPGTNNAVTPEAIGKLEISAQTLLTATVRKKALFRAIMALTAKAGAKDFHTGQPLAPSIYAGSKYDSHHVFPSKRLSDHDRETGIDPQGHGAELILNRALIGASTNRRIKAKKPSVYLSDIEDEGVDIADIFDSHLIDAEALVADDYGTFIMRRLQRIVDKVEQLTGKVVTPLPDDAVASGDAADDEEAGDDEGL